MSDAENIISKLGLNSSLILRKPIRGTKGITVYSLINSILSTDSLMDAANLLDYTSDGPIKKCVAEVLIPHFPEKQKKFGNGGNSGRWRVSLLLLIDKKHCYGCNKNLPLDSFGINIGKNELNLRSTCKACHVFESKEQKQYIKIRTPIWADMEKIRIFYNKCPEGYHVDHIIPLKGKIVSGLHTLDNLQYLFAKDNLLKNNRYNVSAE